MQTSAGTLIIDTKINEDNVWGSEKENSQSPKTSKTILISSKRTSKGSKKKAEKFEDFEDLVYQEGGSKRNDILDFILKGEQIPFNSTICSLIKHGRIVFKREISKGKYGTTLISEVKGLKKGKEYVVKVPHEKNAISFCTTKQEIYHRNDGDGNTIFPKGSYSCDGEFSEFIISLYVGNLSREKLSVNFLDTFYFARCLTENSIKQFMFMEKADSTLRSEFRFMPLNEINSTYIQLLHALALIQEKYSIVHGDLHFDNILLKLDKNICRTYEIGKETVYAPSSKFRAFPADWGMAVKYKEPCVGNIKVLKNQFGGSMPNFFSPSYDVIYLTNSFIYSLHKNNIKSDLIRRIHDWITFKIKDVIDLEEIYFFKHGENTQRPKPDVLDDYFSHVSPLKILTNADLMGEYVNKVKRCEFGGVL